MSMFYTACCCTGACRIWGRCGGRPSDRFRTVLDRPLTTKDQIFMKRLEETLRGYRDDVEKLAAKSPKSRAKKAAPKPKKRATRKRA